jgi:co-chaperonin GroES (HSP10)
MIDAIRDKVVAIMMVREKTASGIIIPDVVQEPQAFCKVISVGNEVTSVKVGDVIVCHIRGGMDVVIDRELVKVLKEEEIYGLLTHKDTLSMLKELIIKKAEKKRVVSL